MKQIRKKLQSRIGESLAETLVAVLVIALALTMLAGMITATANMVTRSKETMNTYYEANTKLETLEDSEPMTIEITGSLTIEVPVKATTNSTFSRTPVIAYGME